MAARVFSVAEKNRLVYSFPVCLTLLTFQEEAIPSILLSCLCVAFSQVCLLQCFLLIFSPSELCLFVPSTFQLYVSFSAHAMVCCLSLVLSSPISLVCHSMAFPLTS